MVKVFETCQGCINTLLLIFKISVFKVQENRIIRRSEARKLRCVNVHRLFDRSPYRRSPVVHRPIKYWDITKGSIRGSLTSSRHGILSVGCMLCLLISHLSPSLLSISLLLHDFISNRRANIFKLWRTVNDNTEEIKETRCWEVYLSWICRNLFYKVLLNILLIVMWTLKQSWSIVSLKSYSKLSTDCATAS